jgi:uncharacterized membrane protein YfhO
MSKKQKRPTLNSPKKTAVQPKATAPAISLDKILNHRSLYIFLGVAVLLVLIIFRRFLSFNYLYLYKDIGSDTVTYWWPHWVMLSNYIKTLGVPKWSFTQGTGQNIYAFGIGDPFSLFLCLLNKNSIPYAIIFMEITKIIGGGLFFYLYLRMLGLSLFTCVVGGLLYSFSGYMILGSGWYLVSAECFYASIVLYTGEHFLRYGTWYLLPIPFFLLGALQPFYLYLYGLLLTVYTIVRFILSGQTQWKPIVISLLKIGSLALFGVILGSVVFLPNLMQLIQNPRVTGDASMVNTLSSSPIFMLSSSVFNSSAIARLFSNDLIGAGSNFKGAVNYLEDPILYVGLVSLLLAPQAFLFFDKKKRRAYLVLAALCLVPMVFVYFRYMFWLFTGDFCRTYTLFLSLLILFLALKALTNIDRTNIVHVKTLLVTLVLLIILLYSDYSGQIHSPVNKDLRNLIAFFLVVYAACIYLFSTPYKVYGVIGLCLCLFVELAYFSNITVNDRVPLKTSELSKKRGYNDYSVEGVAYTKSIDHTFYRITKAYYNDASMFLTINDPQIQNFYGLTDYVEWNQFNYSQFLREMHTETPDPTYAKWLIGPMDRLLLKTMLNTKYVFYKQDNKFNFASAGYVPLSSFGDVVVAKNAFYLPFGYSYNKIIPLSQLRRIQDNTQKDEMLLNACAVDDKDLSDFNGIQQVSATDSLAPLTFESYGKYVGELKADTFRMAHFDENDIIGDIHLSNKKLLFFSIPLDNGWHAFIDGKEAKKYKANVGFTGLILEKGDHHIELHFTVPLLAAGAWISAISFLIYILALIKFRKVAL